MLRNIRNAIVIFLFAASGITPACAAGRYEHAFAKTLNFRGGRVSVEHRFGNVTLRAVPGSQVTVHATIRASSESMGQSIQISATEESGGVSIRTIYPASFEHHTSTSGETSFSVDYDITIPENAPLSLHNRFGNTSVSGLRAAGEIVSGMGSVTLRDCNGLQRVENSFGSIEASDMGGDLHVVNANGNVRVSSVRGQLDVTDRFGSVDVTGVQHNAAIQSSNGTVDLRNVGENASITNSFGMTTVTNIGAALKVKSQNGGIAVVKVGGAATIETSFGTVNVRDATNVSVQNGNGDVVLADLRGGADVNNSFGLVRGDRIRGGVKVESRNAGVTLNDIGGALHVETSFGSVFLKGLGGAITVHNENGAISVAGVKGACQSMSLETTFSSIKVAIAPTASYTVAASTSFSPIRTELPLEVTESGHGTLRGTLGSGTCRLELKNQNGSIVLEKE